MRRFLSLALADLECGGVSIETERLFAQLLRKSWTTEILWVSMGRGSDEKGLAISPAP
jgi:hypothetical protein